MEIDLLLVPVGAGEVALLAVEDVAVGGVPVLHHLQALVDLPAQRRRGQVVGEEGGLDGPAEFDQRSIGVLRS
jgi:hypothetical protein